MSPETILLVVGVTAAAYMAWNIGANDVANAMGTSVGSGALTLMGAVVLAGVFEFAGATLVGTHVTETVRKGILETGVFQGGGPALDGDGAIVLMIGMVSALVAAGVWLQIATAFGLPVSTTHSIIGALVGFGLVAVGGVAVNWGMIGKVGASWVVSPVLGGAIAAGMFLWVSHRVLRRDDPIGASRRQGPYLVGLVIFILVLSFVYKALGNVIEEPAWWAATLTALGAAAVSWAVTRFFLGRRADPSADPYDYVERIFGRLQIVTACFVAFAHGANDVANAVGPVAAVVQIHSLGELPAQVPVPTWILVLGAVGIVIGLATWGYKVIATVGRSITELTPTRGFSAEFGAAVTVLIASRLGLPISTTHTLVGAVIGVGMARGIAALNLRVVWRIVGSWIVTLPVAGAFAAGLYLLLKALLL